MKSREEWLESTYADEVEPADTTKKKAKPVPAPVAGRPFAHHTEDQLRAMWDSLDANPTTTNEVKKKAVENELNGRAVEKEANRRADIKRRPKAT